MVQPLLCPLPAHPVHRVDLATVRLVRAMREARRALRYNSVDGTGRVTGRDRDSDSRQVGLRAEAGASCGATPPHSKESFKQDALLLGRPSCGEDTHPHGDD